MSTNQRLSPGVYRTSSGQIVHSANGGSGSVRRPTAARPGAAPTNAGPYSGTQLNNAGDVLNTASNYGAAAAGQSNTMTNPNQVTPFGSQTVTYGPNGQPTLTQDLSQGNQNVLNGIQGNSLSASQVLGGLLGGGNFGALSNPDAPMSAYQQAMYSQLTQGNADNKRREGEQLSQTLANRGIPVGSEAYDDQMKQFNQRYDTLDQNARNQAVTGGVNTGLSAANIFGQIGQGGFYNPNFQGYSGAGPQQVDVGGLYGTIQSANIAQQQLNKNRGGGGGGGRSSGAPSSGPIFSNSPIPGSG